MSEEVLFQVEFWTPTIASLYELVVEFGFHTVCNCVLTSDNEWIETSLNIFDFVRDARCSNQKVLAKVIKILVELPDFKRSLLQLVALISEQIKRVSSCMLTPEVS